MLNEDYREMLQYLADEKVKFMLVGAYALAAHGYPLHIPSLDDLIRNKRATGRTKELADVEALELLRNSG
jgi:hypothetical protein